MRRRGLSQKVVSATGANQTWRAVKGAVLDPEPGSMGEPAPAPELLTASSAAARLGVAERTIRRAIDRGELRAVKRAGKFHITREALDRYERLRSRSHDTGADDLSPGHRADAPAQSDLILVSRPP